MDVSSLLDKMENFEIWNFVNTFRMEEMLLIENGAYFWDN